MKLQEQSNRAAHSSAGKPISLGDNPVNAYRARQYACESSPSTLDVLIEFTENARDNGTDVVLTIDVAECRKSDGETILTPSKIVCSDNGTGLSHHEFLNRFCGAFQESDAHHDTDRSGRNGVGTKTYTSIARTVHVRTTTARPTEGLNSIAEQLQPHAPTGVTFPLDGEPDTLWRSYFFHLHTREVLPSEWSEASEYEMGTDVELRDIIPETEIRFETLIERLSYSREWLENKSHSFTIKLTGNAQNLKRETLLRPWSFPVKDWLVKATGRSDEPLVLLDPTTKKSITIAPMDSKHGVIEFDFRVVNRDEQGKMQLERPALLLEICGALPYASDLGGVQSARTNPLLSFLGLEHVSSIGSFCTAISGHARTNSLALKQMLRNNKTSLASGPGTECVRVMRNYLHEVGKALHKIWYNATRATTDEVTTDAVRDAQTEVNLAIKGGSRDPFAVGPIIKSKRDRNGNPQPSTPPRRHRWECGACQKRWLANAGFVPSMCAEVKPGGGKRDGCASKNIGLAKNQPRIGDCEIRLEQLNDPRIPATFQFEKHDDDTETPVVRVNIVGPRFVELRGSGSMSGQAQRRLKQYLVDVSLFALAEFRAQTTGGDVTEILGDLYFSRMIRSVGVKQYENQVKKLLADTEAVGIKQELVAAD